MEQIIWETRGELASNPQWRNLYRDYVNRIRRYREDSNADNSEVEKFLFKTSTNNKIVALLLDVFKKERNKALEEIQPVMLNKEKGMYLAMPVPFVVEEGAIKYTASKTSDHIDIIARKDKGWNSHPCIMSVVTDSNMENCRLAGERALKYAVFIAALLKSDSLGYDWWNVIRDQDTEDKDVPEQLNIDVVVAVPQGLQSVDHFNGGQISLNNLNCTFHFHTLYYNKQALLDGTLTGFSGSYSN